MTDSTLTAIAARLNDSLGSEAAIALPDQLDATWSARWPAMLAADAAPPLLVMPTTEASLAAAIALARAQDWPLAICGSGSKLSWGAPARGLRLLISTQRLTQLWEHAVGDLTVTAAAGLRLADLQAALAPSGQFLPLDPAYPETATLGGIVATADAGSWRQRYGSPRDLLLGLSFVRADGEIAKAGGRVVKNVAGYDLMKLFAGSYGSLGAIARVTFRTYPCPEASATAWVAGPAAAVARARTALFQSPLTPTAAELLSASLARALDLGEQPGLLVRYQSIPDAVGEQVERWQQLAAGCGLQGAALSAAADATLWSRLSQQVRATENAAIACKIGILPSQATDLLAMLAASAPPDSLAQIQASSGVGYLRLPLATPAATLASLREFCAARQGYLTLLEAPLALKQQLEPWGYSGQAIAAMRRLKDQFDPSHLFSPGRFVGGI